MQHIAHLVDYFDRIVIINLPERLDRKRLIIEEMEKIGAPLSDKVRLFVAIRPEIADGFETIGAHGCFLSHLAVLKEALSDKVDRLLVLEDDLLFNRSFFEKEEAVIFELKKAPWSIAYLGHEIPKQELSQEILQRYDKPLEGAFFVGFSSPVLTTLVPYLEEVKSREPGDPRGGKMHLDGAYNHFRREYPQFLAYVTNPSLGRQRSSRSDITVRHWFDRIYGLREALAWLREWKERFFQKI